MPERTRRSSRIAGSTRHSRERGVRVATSVAGRRTSHRLPFSCLGFRGLGIARAGCSARSRRRSSSVVASDHEHLDVVCHTGCAEEPRRAGRVRVSQRYAPRRLSAFSRSHPRGARDRDLLIALSEGVAGELRTLLPHARVSVVPHPPYSVLDSGPGRSRTGRSGARESVPARTERSCCFSGSRPYKGLRDLIDAFPRVADTGNAVLVVAGTFFESIDSYQARVDELGIHDSVRIFDEYIPNEDVASLFAMSDLVVLPYRSASTERRHSSSCDVRQAGRRDQRWRATRVARGHWRGGWFPRTILMRWASPLSTPFDLTRCAAERRRSLATVARRHPRWLTT